MFVHQSRSLPRPDAVSGDALLCTARLFEQGWKVELAADPTAFYSPSLRFLEEVDEDYCQCPFGAAGKEVGSWDR